MSAKVYKSLERAQQRVETLRRTLGVWPGIIGTDAIGYCLTYEPGDPPAPGRTARAASPAEVAAGGRQQQRAALEAAFGGNAKVAERICSKLAGPSVGDNISAALAWASEHPDAKSRPPAYVTTAVKRAIRDKRYQVQPEGIPFSHEWLEWIQGERREMPDSHEDRARLEWYEQFYTIWLGQFPEQDAECFRQVVMHKRSTRDVADDLGIPQTTVRRKVDKIRVEIDAQHRAHKVTER